MNRFSTFLFGLFVGAGLMFVGLKYHIVRASDGFHWVPKMTAKLGSVYTDVRGYTVDDWRDHQDLVIAITESDDDTLKEEAAKSALGNTFEGAWQNWTGTTP